MKSVDASKVRSAILYLEGSGSKEFAQVVWDLLDAYHRVSVATPPRPAVLRQDGPQVERAPKFPGYPTCKARNWNSRLGTCASPVAGYVVAVSGVHMQSSVPVCKFHGERISSEDAVDWVQTFFGDEDTAADVEEYQARMTF